MPFIRFTEEQKQQANHVDLPEFLMMRGEKLERAGREYKLIYTDETGKHDSIVVGGSTWYDHKNHVGGGPIQFMQMFYDMSFPEAVQALLGRMADMSWQSPPRAAPPPPKKEFLLPRANADMHRVYAYLIKQRFISPDIITHFAKQHTLYEDADYHNAVFVGLDENGVPKQAHKRSTITYGTSFRMTCEGSDTRYSFAHFGTSGRLFVFEAPIDLLSFLTLFPENWQEHSYIAMNGVYENAMLRALETHPNLQEIILCTDHDEGGIDAAYRLADILAERGYSCVKRFAPALKDWNEQLKYQYGADYLPAVPHRRLETYHAQADELPEVMCVPEQLSRSLHDAFQEKNYQYLAGFALAGSAYFLQRAGYAVGFEKLRQRLKSSYRPYSDKASESQKMRNLGDKTNQMLRSLQQEPVTKEQCVQMAKQLFALADASLKVSTEEMLSIPTVVCGESEEEAPAMAYG